MSTASVIPPVPLSTTSSTRAPLQKPTSNEPFIAHLVKNEEGTVVLEDSIFEFPDQAQEKSQTQQQPIDKSKPCVIPLRSIVRQYLSVASAARLPVAQLWLILGRLRSLQHVIAKYNEGAISQSSSYLNYWRRRTLDQLSGFGFRVQFANQSIVIPGLNEFIDKMEELYRVDIDNGRQLIDNGLVVFEALGELYRPGVAVLGRTSSLGGTPGVFMVVESYYEERRSLVGMEKSFHYTMEFVASMGEHFTVVRFSEVLSGWMGVRARPLSELTYTPVRDDDADERKRIMERAHKYTTYGVGGARFVAYKPSTFFLHHPPSRTTSSSAGASLAKSGSSLLNSGGRVMIDQSRGSLLGHHASQGADEPTNAMVSLAGRYRRWLNTQASASSVAGSGGSSSAASSQTTSGDSLYLWDSVPEDLLMFCWPALVGFSFSAKCWGHVLVNGLEDIDFHDQAFDQLVLAPERKALIRALVRFGGDENTDDIVSGKRGGSIFLLYGPPGVGKTLTAEAIAEVLHRPLYYVTMGELGLTPDELERRLSDVLELCAAWNALVLLDEADVFLEQRSSADIVRNAMVCVMLRLLEYHPGILFLTTNRVRHFDPAFESRVTVALRYDSLTPEARTKVWRNLLARVSGVAVDSKKIKFKRLGKHELNGRQIKNAVRLAVALAREKQCDVTQEILDTTLAITQLGRDEMKQDDSWKEPPTSS